MTKGWAHSLLDKKPIRRPEDVISDLQTNKKPEKFCIQKCDGGRYVT